MTTTRRGRKRKILDYIAATLRARGYPAVASARSRRRSGLASTSAVHHHLLILEREGYLERGAAQSRAIRLTPHAALRLGLTSELVAAVGRDGGARPAGHRRDRRRRPDRGVPGRVGDHGGPGHARAQRRRVRPARPRRLDDRGAHRGWRLRRSSARRTTARNGDIVVAQVEENAVTLKRFFKEKDRVRLQPANPAYPPQFYDDVRIQGKLIGVIRRLD